MNYLKNNLENSKLLPYDIIKLIYEYADPLIAIRRQIENKEYDLDEIMYQRMKNFIIKKNQTYIHYTYYLYTANIYIHRHNIHNRDLKEYLLNAREGYKALFLREHKLSKICGSNFNNHQLDYKKFLMIKDLRRAKIYKRQNTICNDYKMKNVYKKWLKL